MRRFGKKNQVATDIGCGIGHFLPMLSCRFRTVLALDISATCIARETLDWIKCTPPLFYGLDKMQNPRMMSPGSPRLRCQRCTSAQDVSRCTLN